MPARNSHRGAETYAVAFVLTFSLFALWGLGHKLYDMLLEQFEQVFALEGAKLVMTQSVYAFAYMLCAVPAALCSRRFGYKAAILFGLGSIATGSFALYPAAETHAYSYFLVAATVMSCGWALIEIAAMPLVAALGSEQTSIRRLNLAQSFYTPGALAGWMAGHWLIVSHLALPKPHYTYSIIHPYVAMALVVLLLAFTFEGARFPSVATAAVRGFKGISGEFRRLLSSRIFAIGIGAQFFCAVALGGSWSYSDSYFTNRLPALSLTAIGGPFVLVLIVFGIGRFVGTALMYRFAPERILAVFCGCGALIMAVATVADGPLAAICVIASSFFLSVTWPTVIGIAIRGRGPLMKLGTGLLYVAAAIGGTLYRWVAAAFPVYADHYGMAVASVSYGVLLAYAVFAARAYRLSLAPGAFEAVMASE